MLRSIIAKEWDDPGRSGHDVVFEIVRQDPDAARRVRIMEAVAGDGRESRFALARVLAGSGEGDRALKVLEVLRRETPADHRYAPRPGPAAPRPRRARRRPGSARRPRSGERRERRPPSHPGAAPHLHRTPGGGPRPRTRPSSSAARTTSRRALGARPAADRDGAIRRRPPPTSASSNRWPGWAQRGVVLHRPHRRRAGRSRPGAPSVPEGARRVVLPERSGSAPRRSWPSRGELRWARWHLCHSHPRATPRAMTSGLYRAESGLLLRADRPAEAIHRSRRRALYYLPGGRRPALRTGDGRGAARPPRHPGTRPSRDHRPRPESRRSP